MSDDIPAEDGEVIEEPEATEEMPGDMPGDLDDTPEGHRDETTGGAAAITPEVAAVLGPDAQTFAEFGARVADTLVVGLESVVAQTGQLHGATTSVQGYADLQAEFETRPHVALDVQFEHGGEAYPLAALVPLQDIGALFTIDISPEQMADEDYAGTQLEMISAGLKELLDLGGLMLFTGPLSGAEATLQGTRSGNFPETLGPLLEADADPRALRIDLRVGLPNEAEATLTVLIPVSLVPRIAALAAGAGHGPPPVGRAPLSAVEPESSIDEPSPARASGRPTGGGFEDEIGDRRPPEPEIEAHPVRFPTLVAPVNPVEMHQGIDLIMDVSLRVSVELGRSSMTVQEVLDLGPGSVVELNKLAGEPVDILINDRAIARGEVVVVDENFGVRVTEILSPQHRVRAMSR